MVCFFFQFCDVAEVVIIHKMVQPDLATDMKIGKKSESFYILWLPAGTDHKNLAIWKLFFFSKSGEFWGIFFYGKSFVQVEIIFIFQVEIWRIFAPKKNTGESGDRPQEGDLAKRTIYEINN